MMTPASFPAASFPPAVFPDAVPALLEAFTPAARDLLPGLVIHEGVPDRAALIGRLRGHVGFLNNESYVDDEVLDACPELKVMVFLGTGVSSYVDLAACARRGVMVRNVVRYGDRTVAEHTVGLLFAVFRRIAQQDAALRAGRWQGGTIGELRGRTIGIVGFGGVGREVADLARALGMRVLCWTRTSPADAVHCEFVGLDELLARADVVSLHIGLTEETRGFLDAGRLRRMKRGAVLINTARGAVLDEGELASMLRDGHLSAAGLDVYTVEPLPPGHELTTLPNVTLTCHTGWQSPEAAERLMTYGARALREELEAYAAGAAASH
ncbi:2-hydroxyacid dehydrogenase [Arenibaculum sp.]|uniref:2-hydroxyacid dehydrogenase n=1 Tax=Arenibaculum sp. TaxID=2865862 RepID=UPI002E14CC4E|nr:NAD(P)-dependent oxidoreductase [Arenibaculum sp.]